MTVGQINEDGSDALFKHWRTNNKFVDYAHQHGVRLWEPGSKNYKWTPEYVDALSGMEQDMSIRRSRKTSRAKFSLGTGRWMETEAWQVWQRREYLLKEYGKPWCTGLWYEEEIKRLEAMTEPPEEERHEYVAHQSIDLGWRGEVLNTYVFILKTRAEAEAEAEAK